MKRYLTPLLLALALGIGAGASQAQEPARIDINSATAEQLATLPGIGEVRARAIIEDRKAHGDYTSAQDLTRIDGIGEATAEGLKDRLAF